MIQLTGFEVTARKLLAEDRIEFHIATHITLDKARAREFKQQQLADSRLFGYGNFGLVRKAERFYKRFQGTTHTALLLYRRKAPGVWQLAGMREAAP